ncbi:MAG: hypothetical protein KC517_11150 [Bacteroidetes bacterium]|jgi:hypothetical protein|nr:hypothetical protein [Bacteroidota bacterium]
MDINKSIEQLENHAWEERENYYSVTLKNCHDFRKIPLKDLTIKQAVTLLQNDIGSEHLMPVVMERMHADLYEEDPEDGSTFLEHIDGFKNEMFQRSSDLWKPMMALLRTRREEVEQYIGWKRYEDLIHKMMGR